ncbi:MAG: hypothetical protein AB9866_21420 [Syntrophobacteraceae bacterium]
MRLRGKSYEFAVYELDDDPENPSHIMYCLELDECFTLLDLPEVLAISLAEDEGFNYFKFEENVFVSFGLVRRMAEKYPNEAPLDYKDILLGMATVEKLMRETCTESKWKAS